MSLSNDNTTKDKEAIGDDEPEQKETLLTSSSSWTKWKNLDLLNETKIYGNKHSLDDLFSFIQENYKLEKRFERTRSILSLIKIIAHSFVLIHIAVIYILHYSKCLINKEGNGDDEFISNFTATLPYNINETIHLRIKFCSPLYDNNFYLDRDHFTLLAHFFEYSISKLTLAN